MDERTFSLAEAKSLLPQLEEKLLAVKSEKEVLVRSHGEIKRASANAQANGGSVVGPRYIRASSGSATASRPSRKWGSWSRTSTSGSVTFLSNTTTGSSTSAGSWASRKSASGTKSKMGTRDASPSKPSTSTTGDLRDHRVSRPAPPG